MKLQILSSFFFVISIITSAQDIKRVEITGKIVVNSDDLENVTIFNTSSNQGTLTDENGKFNIKVALNDIIEVRALQFQEFKFTIDKNVIDSKRATIFLVEKINKLPEVVILPYDLTGNLTVDMQSVRTFNPDLDAIYFGITDISAYEFADDRKSEVVNIAARGPGNNIQYPLDVVAVVGLLLKPLFNSNKDKNNKTAEQVANIPTNGLRDYYSAHYLEENFNIPENQVEAFVTYVEANGLDYTLMKKGKEMEFLEFLNQKSKDFLKAQSEKN